MRHRREIDGLRALAVIPVMLFHAGVEHFSGGYLGVDIFFMISGFLISSIIFDDLEKGSFSLIRFYERRVRRIFPALFLVVIATLPFAWVLMLPTQFKDYAESLVMVSLFASNVQFWQDVGYFAPNADLIPLLHTWSLAIEEQYYLFAPLVTMVLWPFGKRVFFVALVAIAALSFLVCVWGAETAPQFNFYFTLSRVWELAVGAMCGLAAHNGADRPNDPLALLGLIAIAGSMALFGLHTPHPSYSTLAPVAGTALVLLFARHGTVAAKILSWRPLVGIGLISYSLYLWHYPLLAFARIAWPSEAGNTALMLGMCALSFGLAYASWRYVEQPFRSRKQPLLSRRPRLFAAAALGPILLISVGTLGVETEGLPMRISPSGFAYGELGISQKVALNYGLSRLCEGDVLDRPECRTSDTPKYALWGDSYAMQLANAMRAGKPDIAMVQYTRSSCTPVLDAAPVIAKYGKKSARLCRDFNAHAIQRILESDTIEYVVMSSAFTILRRPLLRKDDTVRRLRNGKEAVAMFRNVAELLRQHGKKLVIVSPAPSNGIDLGACLSHVLAFGQDGSRCDFSTAAYSRFVKRNYDFVRRLSADIPVVMLDDIICQTGVCDTMVGSTFIYRDVGHLSMEGSAFLGAERGLVDRIDDALKADQPPSAPGA